MFISWYFLRGTKTFSLTVVEIERVKGEVRLLKIKMDYFLLISVVLTTSSDSTQITTAYTTPVLPRSQPPQISVISTKASTTLHASSTNKLMIASTAASTLREIRVTPSVKESIASSSAIKDIPTSHIVRASTSTAHPTTDVPEKGTVYINLHFSYSTFLLFY